MTSLSTCAARVVQGLGNVRAAAVAVAVALILSVAFSPAFANETVAYTYDALGRLVQVARTGTVNNGTTASYTYDKADNRTNVTVSIGGSTTLTVNPTALPSGTVGTAYSQTISASGGTSPYTYSTTAGTLPAGLTLNSSTGLLSGSPSTAATYSFTITATDSASNTGNRPYTVTMSSSGGSTCSGVSFSVNDTSATEADPLVFTISKAGTTSSSCSITYATANGSAIAPGDYTAIAATVLTFTSTQTSRTVSVTTKTNGASEEPDETMYLNLSNPSGGATISDSQGVGTIFDFYDANPCPLC